MFELVALLVALDIDRLGHPDWFERESAEWRLKAWSVLAVPKLLTAAQSNPSPEIRMRSAGLLTTWRVIGWELEAAAALSGPSRPDELVFWRSELLRLRVHRQAVAAGCPQSATDPLLPESDYACWWFWEPPAWIQCGEALARCREEIRGTTAPQPRVR